MNKLLKPLATLALFVSLSTQLRAQVNLLITTSRETVFSPDTAACFGDPYVITATITTVGVDSIAIPFVLKMRTPLGVYSLDSASVGGPANDSINITILDTYSASRFGGGGNIIVIWPDAMFFPPVDSVRDTVVVLCPTGSEDFTSHQDLSAFPNPSADGVFQLQAEGAAFLHCSMQVHDAAGRLVRRYDAFEPTIDLSNLPQGLYHLTVMDRQRPPIHLKLIR